MTNILLFLFVLGVLIFVHEMGHFLAAKACNVYVDRFSLGMPPRLFGFKYGETDYCIGMLPIGGYVKMAGQEDAPLSDEERQGTYGHVPPERWFNNRPRYQRAIILVAGPVMNLLLGFVVYALMAGVGGEVPLAQVDNRIGDVLPDSPASQATMHLVPEGGGEVDFNAPPDATGWRTGDRVVNINGNKVNGLIQDVVVEAVIGEGKYALAEIERVGDDGIARRYLSRLKPERVEGQEFPAFGIGPYNTALVSALQPDSPAEKAGLAPNDEITHANGNPIDRETLIDAVHATPNGQPIHLAVLRDGKPFEIDVTTQTRGRIQDVAFMPPPDALIALSDQSELRIANDDRDFNKQSGLNPDDLVQSIVSETGEAIPIGRITSLPADQKLTVAVERSPGLWGEAQSLEFQVTAAQLMEAITGFDPDAQPIVIGVLEAEEPSEEDLKRRDVVIEIDGKPATASLLREIQNTRGGESVPIKVRRPSVLFGCYQDESIIETTLPIASVQEIGIAFGEKKVFHRAPAGQIIPEAWDRCVRVTVQIGTVLKLLFTGGLSPKTLGGPVMIYEITTGAANTNFVYFLDVLAMISINLAIFNLLPLPVLDGGQLLFLGIEAIRRKPVSVRVLETVQQAGLLLIIGLILYVTFNDVLRIADRILP